MKVNAILFDIRSIQKYIFSGNKLRTNIGASHITANLFQEILIEGVLTENKSWLGDVDTDSWQTLEQDFTELPTDIFVAQVGGGKALILLKSTSDQDADREKMKNIVRLFNKRVLENYPGINTGAALGSVDLGNFIKDQESLFRALKENQNTVYPTVNPPYTGLTHFCESDGEVADYCDREHIIDRQDRLYSREILSKAQAAEDSNEYLKDIFDMELRGRKFPREFDKLGQRETENYYAIVHIDGNNMGVRFRNCQNLPDYNKLALSVQQNTRTAFVELLDYIDANYERFVTLGNLKLNDVTLPLRPLILGEDDVTFVCAAKVALELTTVYMRALLSRENENERLYTCAGIAILPTSYPFFRGYKMTEQLCGAAKEKSRGVDSCWLDFGILHGEQAPTLAQIRRQEYSGAQGDLHFGPYRVDAADEVQSVENLFACVRGFAAAREGRRIFPTNKLKEMRAAIAKDRHEIESFLEQLAHTGVSLPRVAAWRDYERNFWYNGKTPYIDAIEMVDFIVDKEASRE